jgi:hypothetical protein
VAILLAALLAVVALGSAACSPEASPTLPFFTQVPIGPTPWASGTTGQYGLHIDPSLLGRLPKTVDAYPLVEDPGDEEVYMDDTDRSQLFDNLAAAKIGDPSDDNWLVLEIGHFRPVPESPSTSAGSTASAGSSASDSSAGTDPLESWIPDYQAQACSQASGVASTSQETINFWVVDTAQCSGGPTVYIFPLGNGEVLSMFGFGPLDLGRRLINSLYT